MSPLVIGFAICLLGVGLYLLYALLRAEEF
ncbi:MAG TPA: potassium-transporting ATPase subunit F [Candidatus Limnocylindrales bacterium]|nr:potassium-transporting ATPase subunit F [Candidatus Limnocylindrales bacterium]